MGVDETNDKFLELLPVAHFSSLKLLKFAKSAGWFNGSWWRRNLYRPNDYELAFHELCDNWLACFQPRSTGDVKTSRDNFAQHDDTEKNENNVDWINFNYRVDRSSSREGRPHCYPNANDLSGEIVY